VKFSVYAIVDPRSHGVFYIGHTSRFALRCEQHRAGDETLSGLTVQQIQKSGHELLFVKLEVCETKEAALSAEIFWIELFKARGAQLMNAQGFAGYVARDEERRRLKVGLGDLAGIKFGSDQLLDIANGRPARRGHSWMRKEDDLLTRMVAEGRSLAEMADRLGRTIGAVEARLAGRAPKSERGQIKARRRRRGITIH